MISKLLWFLLPALLLGSVAGAAQRGSLDLTQAVLLCPTNLPAREQKAVHMLVEEVEKRTQVRWPVLTSWPSSNTAVIAVSTTSLKDSLPGPYTKKFGSVVAAEGYYFSTFLNPSNPVVAVIGNDSRGVLFGVGKLLRELQMEPGKVSLDPAFGIISAPKSALRGHQLGFRPKCNSYDAWDLPVWEQQYRDLAVFGCNAIELIPPRSDDAADSPHFPRPPMEMMVGMSRLADEYGLDVWIWYPALDQDYSDPKTVEFALREWGEVFSKLPRIDAVFVPGGDPGHTQPKWLMALLEKQTENLRRYHPKAQMWLSPQGFTQSWVEEFFEMVRRDQPSWLHGVVFGPQVRTPLPQLRERLPARYPIRHYPDITHTRQCQFPVPDWDVAFAITEGRECINPRPADEAAMFRATERYTVGFLTYSEGCNDDVNKFVWSGLGWNPEARVVDILKEYSRYFIGGPQADRFAQGLLALENNWRGPAVQNDGIEQTLNLFQELERAATPAQLKNWRFQQPLFRAYYDAYIRHRLIYERRLEQEAMRSLQSAKSNGASNAMAAAEQFLERATTEPVKPQWRARINELAEGLFQSIRMQLSVQKYKAIAVDRGASLDTLDFPLNNRNWLQERFAAIRKMPSEEQRLAAIREIVEWTDPGPGGHYDDLGNIANQPHLVRGPAFNEDPGFMRSSRVGFEEDPPDEAPGSARRISWMDHAETLYDTPLQMRYTELDPRARYKLRVLYGGDNPKKKVRLLVNDKFELHPLIPKPVPFRPLEFSLPAEATASGELTLTWHGEPGLGGNGRGCQVSEVWLVKESPGKK
jgi:hypothetical protein